MSSLESQEREIHNVLFDVAKVDSQNPLGPTLSQLALKHQLLLSQSSQESDIIVKAFGVTCSQVFRNHENFASEVLQHCGVIESLLYNFVVCVFHITISNVLVDN